MGRDRDVHTGSWQCRERIFQLYIDSKTLALETCVDQGEFHTVRFSGQVKVLVLQLVEDVKELNEESGELSGELVVVTISGGMLEI
jgi:hypothetical protein